MGYDLVNQKNEVYHSPLIAFREMIDLAERYGWQPMGTLPPEDAQEWDGNYFYDNGQIVTGEDLKAMADGLERALSMSPQLFLEEDKAQIRDFINFCRESDYLFIY